MTLPPMQIDQIPETLYHMGFGDLHIKYDPATELVAIIAIHSAGDRPTIGGCRCLTYPSFAAALHDAFRLAQGMSYKTALSGLAWGGAKAVLCKPPVIQRRAEYYRAFGRFVNELNGRYVTSIDSGTDLSDLSYIAQETPYVIGSNNTCNQTLTDPAFATAMGVVVGIKAAVKVRLQRESLTGLTIAVQGVGHVGYQICRLLHQEHVKLIVTDINEQAIQRCVTEFSATPVAPAKIYTVACDVFSPCALGGVLNQQTIPQLQTRIIAGSANNQLADIGCDDLLQQQDILYAPDIAISAGGAILATSLYEHCSQDEIRTRIARIEDTLLAIFAGSQQQRLAPQQMAIQMANEYIQKGL